MKQPAARASLLFALVLGMGGAAAAGASALDAEPAAAAQAKAGVPAETARAIQAATDGTAAANTVAGADLRTIDGVLAALYGTISGAAGQARDWDRLHTLFMHDGRMVVHGMNKEGEMTTRVLTVSDYISRMKPVFAKEGFYETELARSTETFGQIAHVFSTYESRRAAADAHPFQRGINSIQLVNDGERWWIQSLVWQAETDKNPIPARYLHSR
ncbi:MAG: hypothetical protein V4724_23040 [Pseudomonadota bacterium]